MRPHWSRTTPYLLFRTRQGDGGIWAALRATRIIARSDPTDPKRGTVRYRLLLAGPGVGVWQGAPNNEPFVTPVTE